MIVGITWRRGEAVGLYVTSRALVSGPDPPHRSRTPSVTPSLQPLTKILVLSTTSARFLTGIDGNEPWLLHRHGYVPEPIMSFARKRAALACTFCRSRLVILHSHYNLRTQNSDTSLESVGVTPANHHAPTA